MFQIQSPLYKKECLITGETKELLIANVIQHCKGSANLSISADEVIALLEEKTEPVKMEEVIAEEKIEIKKTEPLEEYKEVKKGKKKGK